MFIPREIETVSLRHACRRLDGSVIWSIIHEDDWRAVLDKTGEEIGVFLPTENPEKISYGQVRLSNTLLRLCLFVL